MRFGRIALFLFVFTYQMLFSYYNDLEHFPLPQNHIERIDHFILPPDDPLKKIMDDIFLSSRATQDYDHFIDAGFHPYFFQPRSFIVVAGHDRLPGYLVKLQLDTELRVKEGKPYWEWFLRRCEGSKKIQEFIDSNNIHHFVVPKKWIYPLPLNPAPPATPEYEQKLMVILVEDMELVTEKENIKAWNTLITKEHLDELYLIFLNSYASSFRADNVSYTRSGKFAFIDTEYNSKYHPPRCGPIRRHLNPEMRAYWDELNGIEELVH